MYTYLVRRLLLIIPTLFGISLVIFMFICRAPGDPAALKASQVLDPTHSARIYAEYVERWHLDEPWYKRYFMWLGEMVQGDLGRSMADDKPVLGKILQALWPTVKVNLAALFIAFGLSVPIGILSAARQNGWFDRAGGVVLYILYSIPSYVGAIILVLYISVRWNLLPFRGDRGDLYEELSYLGRFWDQVAHMALYTMCAAYGSIAFLSRFVRQNLLEVVRQDYVRTARAKGLPEHVVVIKHGFRNTMIPFVTLLGLSLPFLLGGSVILEVIFTWPGLGRLFYTSILERDMPVIMALSTATALLVLVATLAVDLLYGVIDPRVSHR